MNALREKHFRVWKVTKLIFMPASLEPDAEAALENSRTRRILAHQEFPDLWGRSWRFTMSETGGE